MTQISYHNIRNNYNNWDNTSKQSSHVPQSASLQNANKAAAWTDSILCTRYTALFSVDVEMSPLNSRVVLLQWHSFRLATLTDVSVAWAVFFLFFSFGSFVLFLWFESETTKSRSHQKPGLLSAFRIDYEFNSIIPRNCETKSEISSSSSLSLAVANFSSINPANSIAKHTVDEYLTCFTLIAAFS